MHKILFRDDTINDAFIPVPEHISAKDKLSDFKSLKAGWHFGEGKAISQNAIGQAKEILRVASRLMSIEIDAFPGVDGRVVLSFYPNNYKSNKHILDLEIDGIGPIKWTHERDDEEIDSGESATIHEALGVIKNYRNETCSSYESSLKDTGTGDRADSSPLHLYHLTEESLWFQPDVSPILTNPPANTCRNAMIL